MGHLQAAYLKRFYVILAIMLGAQSLLLIALSSAAPVKRNAYTFLQPNTQGDIVFELGNLTYLANAKHPKTTLTGDVASAVAAGFARPEIPITVINTNVSTISQDVLTTIIQSYVDGDDVFTEDFLETIF